MFRMNFFNDYIKISIINLKNTLKKLKDRPIKFFFFYMQNHFSFINLLFNINYIILCLRIFAATIKIMFKNFLFKNLNPINSKDDEQ